MLYRQALSSLSVARSISLDQSLIDYLEGLSTRAYFFVYGARGGLWERIGRFFAVDWPEAVRSLWRETAVSALCMLIGVVLVLALATTILFGRIRKGAAWLMAPYLAWLCFAGVLNYKIDQLNPNAETLVPGQSAPQMNI